jgi:hypothetical protein
VQPHRHAQAGPGGGAGKHLVAAGAVLVAGAALQDRRSLASRSGQAGITPEDIEIRKPDLEDVFLALTGSSPAPAPVAEEVAA